MEIAFSLLHATNKNEIEVIKPINTAANSRHNLMSDSSFIEEKESSAHITQTPENKKL